MRLDPTTDTTELHLRNIIGRAMHGLHYWASLGAAFAAGLLVAVSAVALTGDNPGDVALGLSRMLLAMLGVVALVAWLGEQLAHYLAERIDRNRAHVADRVGQVEARQAAAADALTQLRADMARMVDDARWQGYAVALAGLARQAPTTIEEYLENAAELYELGRQDAERRRRTD